MDIQDCCTIKPVNTSKIFQVFLSTCYPRSDGSQKASNLLHLKPNGVQNSDPKKVFSINKLGHEDGLSNQGL